MENTREQIIENLAEIKKSANIDDCILKEIFRNSSSEQLREFLDQYNWSNYEKSELFESFIQDNSDYNLINWIFTEGA